MLDSEIGHRALSNGIKCLEHAVNENRLRCLEYGLRMLTGRPPRFSLFFVIGDSWTMVRNSQWIIWEKVWKL